jgi:general secretion pathway protein A
MYKNFFGLHENPFNINPDPRFLYLTPQIREALDLLTYGVQNRKGCILLTGEVGTGKTTLIKCLLSASTRKIISLKISTRQMHMPFAGT